MMQKTPARHNNKYYAASKFSLVPAAGDGICASSGVAASELLLGFTDLGQIRIQCRQAFLRGCWGGGKLSTISGRVGGVIGGFSVSCTVIEGAVFGRIGGLLRGGNVDLIYDRTKITGRLGGIIIGKDVNLLRQGNSLRGRLGGAVDGKDLFLETDGHKIWGRVGGDFIGFSVDLLFEHGQLRGRLGGEVIGHDVNLVAPESEPLMAGLIACLTYYYYKVTDTGHHQSYNFNS